MNTLKTPVLPAIRYNERVVVAVELRKILEENKDKFLKSYQIIELLNDRGIEITYDRFRKVINYLRCLTYPIVSSSKGYCYTWDKNERHNTISQLESRIESIQAAIDGLRYGLAVEEMDEATDLSELDFM
jgi:hypothetical protein